jgi:hypothetical protein
MPHLILVVSFPSRDLGWSSCQSLHPFLLSPNPCLFPRAEVPPVMAQTSMAWAWAWRRRRAAICCSAMTCVGVGKGTEGEGRINGKMHGRRPGRRNPCKSCRRCFLRRLCSRSACMLHRLCAVMCAWAHIPRPKRQLKSISLAFYCCSVPAPAVPVCQAAPQAVHAAPSSRSRPYLLVHTPLGSTLLHVCVHSISRSLAS